MAEEMCTKNSKNLPDNPTRFINFYIFLCGNFLSLNFCPFTYRLVF